MPDFQKAAIPKIVIKKIKYPSTDQDQDHDQHQDQDREGTDSH